ncbi:MAG: GNAT family N-acetyltransferase [Chloroflexi bacterium]|nr:GNAT family N-acetyltransferase [Chloroflexota bacterium]
MTASTLINDLIAMPDAPAIPGLIFRRFRGPEDYPHMLAVINGSKAADGIERSDTLEALTNNYAHLERCDPYRDMVMAEVDGQMIAYNRAFWDQQDDGARVYTVFGFLLPAWRRKGIGAAMLAHGEERVREIAAEHAYDGPRFFQSFLSEGEVGTRALLERAGYKPVRYGFEMKRDLSEPLPDFALPASLDVRPMKEENLRTLWDANAEAFRDHWGYVAPSETDFDSWIHQHDFNPSLYKVAWDGNEIAGAVQNFINKEENEEYNRKRGYTEGIFVRRPWRKRGLARALIVQSMKMFKEMGMTETALGVDTQNLSGALRVYESCGYRQMKMSITLRKPLE